MPLFRQIPGKSSLVECVSDHNSSSSCRFGDHENTIFKKSQLFDPSQQMDLVKPPLFHFMKLLNHPITVSSKVYNGALHTWVELKQFAVNLYGREI
jgi:hypothetical protein